MNEKVDNEFIGIKDIYVLQCICTELKEKTERLDKELLEVKEQYRNLFEENMRLKREINLHSGKLVVTDIEVKEFWK